MRSSSADRRGLLPKEEGSEAALVSCESPGTLGVECHGLGVPGRPGIRFTCAQTWTNEMLVATRSPAGAMTPTFPCMLLPPWLRCFFTAAWITDAAYWLALAVTAAAFTYYNIPLLETGRPTIGANQYGIFIQAFGLIRWRAIEGIHLVQIAERAMTVHELRIVLNAPLGSALVADWRKQPIYRLLMRLP